MMNDNPHIGQSFSDYLDDQGVREEVEAEAIAQVAMLTTILHADQADAATADLANKVALYCRTLLNGGMSQEAAEQGAAEYQSLLLAQAFMDVHEKLGVGPLFGEAD